MHAKGVIMMVLCAIGAAAAPAAEPAASFTFHRVAVPAKGKAPRITVQIARRLESPTQHAAARPDPPRRAVPRELSSLAHRWQAEIRAATSGTQVSPALVLAVMATESAGRPDAVSPAGALGLMQLMPATAARFGVTDPFDPAENLRGGAAYLNWLLDRFRGDPRLVLAGYNAGEGSVDKHGGIPPFAETLDYVPRVMAAFDAARSLCETPPDLVSDGCIFAPAP